MVVSTWSAVGTVRDKSQKLLNLLRKGRATWLVAAVLATSQLVLIAHQMDAASTHAFETCQICVHLEKLDDGVAKTSPTKFLVHHVRTATQNAVECLYDSIPLRFFHTRAPPKL